MDAVTTNDAASARERPFELRSFMAAILAWCEPQAMLIHQSGGGSKGASPYAHRCTPMPSQVVIDEEAFPSGTGRA